MKATPRWDRVAVLALCIFAAWLLLSHADQAVWLWNQIGNVSAQHARPEDRAYGLLICGIVLISVLAAIKLLTQRDP